MNFDFGDIPDPLGLSAPGAPLRPPSVADADAPLRALTRRRRLVAAVLGFAWLAAHLAVYGVREDFSSLPLQYILAEIFLPFALALAAVGVASSRGKLGFGASVGVVLTLGVLGPLSFLLVALGAPVPNLATPGDHFWLRAVVCLDITLAWTAVPLLLVAMSLRNAFPAAAAARSALAGSACGLFSGAMMNLHCPSVDPLHMALGHGVPVVVATIVGGTIMSRWVRI